MKKTIIPAILILLSSFFIGCQSLYNTGNYLANLVGLSQKVTKTQQAIQVTQTDENQLNIEKEQIAADAVYEAELVLGKDPNIKTNYYELSAIRVLDTDAVPNLPIPTPEAKQAAEVRVTLEINPNTYKDTALLAELNKSYQTDITKDTQIITQEKNDVIKLQQLDQEQINEKNDAINILNKQVNDQNTKIQQEEQIKINTIFAGLGAFIIIIGIILIAFTPLKTQGFMLIGLGIVVAPLGLVYSAPWFKWVSGIGFGTLFIVVLWSIIKGLATKTNSSNNQSISDLFVDSIIQLESTNPSCYSTYKTILDTQLSVNASLKTEIDTRISAALAAQNPSTSTTTNLVVKTTAIVTPTTTTSSTATASLVAPPTPTSASTASK